MRCCGTDVPPVLICSKAGPPDLNAGGAAGAASTVSLWVPSGVPSWPSAPGRRLLRHLVKFVRVLA